MARAIGYDPDPDYADEEDYGYGTFRFDDGTSRYGYDPDLASEVKAYQPPEAEALQDRTSVPDQRMAANDTRPPIDEQRRQLDEFFMTGDTSVPDVTPSTTPKVEALPATKVDTKTKPEKTTTADKSTQPPNPVKAAREAIDQHADGLDPEKLSRIIGFETAGSYSPAAMNPNKAHAGLIQFNKDLWPGVAKAAGKSDVTWEQMQGLSVAEQMPFVTAYFKDKGITKDSSLGDYYLAVAAPALLDKSDDTVAYAKGSKAVAQNPLWDLDKDGQITAGELRRVIPDDSGKFNVVDDAIRNGPADPNAPHRQAAPGMQGPAMAPSMNGLVPTQMDVTGTPLTPEQMAARTQSITDRATTMADATRQAYDPKLDALANRRVELERQAQEKANASEKARLTNEKIKADSQKMIDTEVVKPIQTIDPKRYISGIGAGWGAALRGKTAGPNQALQILLQSIDEDIEAQKEEIRSGEASKNNRIAAWTRKLGDAEMGIKAAQAEADQAAALRLQSHDVSEEEAETQGQRDLAVQTLQDRAQDSINQLTDMEANRRRVTYSAPPTAKPMTYKEQLEEERAKRALDGATGGEAPEIAKVGTEDESEEVRATLADEYDPEKTTHKGQMTALGKEMGQVTKLEENLATLEQAYGVTADENGNYPVYDENEDKYSSNATGPWYNVVDALDPDDPKDRTLKDAWSQVETGTREGWKTEPNGEVKQAELSGIDKAKRDEDVPEKLKALRMEIERRKTTIMSSTDAPVRAAYKIQNAYPLAGQDRGAAVTGKIPTEDDDDGLTQFQRTAPYRRPAGGY